MIEDKAFIPWWRIQYSEVDVKSVAQAVRSEHLSLGPITTTLESCLAKRLQVSYAVATTSGSSAILMALMALGIGSNDEVIIPNRTWIAAAHAVLMVGAKVVLVDVCQDIPIIDINQIEEKITSRTKAIIPTALNGHGVNIEAIQALASKYNLFIIEDSAQALFSQENNKFSGTHGIFGCFSFSVSKLIPTGQGGLVVTNEENFYHVLKKIRTHGVDDLLNCTFNRFGFNFRFTDLQAAIGLTQLEVVEKKIDSLKKIYRTYDKGLKNLSNIQLIPVSIEHGEIPLYIEILTPKREELISFLLSRNIQAKSFYPNLNRARYLNCDETFPQANRFELQGVTLPSGPDQSLLTIERVVATLNEFEEIKKDKIKLCQSV